MASNFSVLHESCSEVVRSGRRRKKGIKETETTVEEAPKVLHSFEEPRSLCSFDITSRGICLNTDCDSEPDRSDPHWKIISCNVKEEVKETTDTEACTNKLTVWEEIMREYEDERLELDNMRKLEEPYEAPLPVLSKLSAVQYLDKYIFPLLCPALEETLLKATEWDCLMIQKCRFSGLDYMAELLWNRNPLHPKRKSTYREIFDIPFAIIWLHYNPRPIYPLSWLWTSEEAITVLQSYIRRYLVCRESDCSEMRQFWKALKVERDETKRLNRIKLIYETEEMFNDIYDQIVANAVYEAEWKIHGCHCISKPCRCVCKCMKWCKCCKCYKNSSLEKAPKKSP